MPFTQDPLADEELMNMVCTGSAEMLGTLFDRYQLPLFSFFHRITNDPSLSEDLVQESFFRILKYRESYKPGSPFRTWMYRIARNALVDALRKIRPEVALEETHQPVVTSINALEAEQELMLLKQALLQLPEEKRELLVLTRYQELSYQEVADMLDCSTGAVKVRVHRALQELRENYRRLEAGTGT